MNITRHLTPVNHSQGRFGASVNKVVLHTMAGSMQPSEDRFFNQRAAVSAHYGVALSGEIRQWVSEGDTAWANGNWKVNTEAISVEHEDHGNYNDPQRTDALYNSSIELITDICRRYNLTSENIHIHKEFSATGCPDGLDVQRIKNGVANALSGVPGMGGAALPQQGVAQVTVTVLRVHNSPDTSDAGNFANTPDGMLHQGDSFPVAEVVKGQDPYGDNRPWWIKSVHGHYVWLHGTNYPVPVEQPVVAPEAPAAPVTPEWEQTWKPLIENKTIVRDNANAVDVTSGKIVAPVDKGTLVHIGGYFYHDGVEYARSVWATENAKWNGIEVRFFEPEQTQSQPGGVSIPVEYTPSEESSFLSAFKDLPGTVKKDVVDRILEVLAVLLSPVLRMAGKNKEQS